MKGQPFYDAVKNVAKSFVKINKPLTSGSNGFLWPLT